MSRVLILLSLFLGCADCMAQIVASAWTTNSNPDKALSGLGGVSSTRGVITNGSLVWVVTNNVLNTGYPNGSIGSRTDNGQLYVLVSSVWNSVSGGSVSLADLQSATNNANLSANGMATKAYADTSSQNATNKLMKDATNTFIQITVAQALTNNFATILYVNAATNGFITTPNAQALTNGFASTSYVNTATNSLNTALSQKVTSGSGIPSATPLVIPAIYLDEISGGEYLYYGGAWH